MKNAAEFPPAEAYDPSLLDPTRWFEQAAGDRIATARRARHRFQAMRELEESLAHRFLAPLEWTVREHFVGLVDYQDFCLKLEGVATYCFEVRPVEGGEGDEERVLIDFVRYRAGFGRVLLAFWEAPLDISTPHSTLGSIARTVGTVLSDAVYRTE